jgi:hypothetical protein
MQDIQRLELSIDARLRGDRTVDFDPEIRALVQLATRMRSSREALSAERRRIIRTRVLERLDTASRPTPLHRTGHEFARPARRMARAAAVLLLGLGLASGATTAGAGSLPDEPLYGWKLALESARVQFAVSPADSASVQLSIAEHRLAEAAALADRQRHIEAHAATSAFGAHLASAALAAQNADAMAPGGVVEGLRDRVLYRTGPAAVSNGSLALEALTELSARLNPHASAEHIAAAAALIAERAAASANGHEATTPRGAELQQQAKAAARAARHAATLAREAAQRSARTSGP